jgi:serine/threonine-protein kinase RsbW
MSDADNKSNPNHPTLEPSDYSKAVKRTYPAQFESLQGIREFVAKQAGDYGFNSNEVYDIQIAVDEAFTNIIEHAYGGECVKDIECACSAIENEFTVTMIDTGITFDPTKVPEPDTSIPLEERDIGGLGVHFMRIYMDEVSFSRIPTSGAGGNYCNQLVMVKRKKA